VEPVKAWAEPISQAKQRVDPVVFEKLPGKQESHTARAEEAEKEPATQRSHLIEPYKGCELPATHSEQIVEPETFT
jgi:hypothetical protein